MQLPPTPTHNWKRTWGPSQPHTGPASARDGPVRIVDVTVSDLCNMLSNGVYLEMCVPCQNVCFSSCVFFFVIPPTASLTNRISTLWGASWWKAQRNAAMDFQMNCHRSKFLPDLTIHHPSKKNSVIGGILTHGKINLSTRHFPLLFELVPVACHQPGNLRLTRSGQNKEQRQNTSDCNNNRHLCEGLFKL